jgi:hypothetical protein
MNVGMLVVRVLSLRKDQKDGEVAAQRPHPSTALRAGFLENREKRGTPVNGYFLYFFSPFVLWVLSY